MKYVIIAYYSLQNRDKMGRKVKITAFKTKRINKLTGGKIGTYAMPDYPGDDRVMENVFITQGGQYIGDYAMGWRYVKLRLKVCDEYPHGLASLHDDRGILLGYYGYTHRGGQTFRINDRIFDERYDPKEADYTKLEWAKFKTDQIDAVKRNLKSGWVKTEEEGFNECPISDVIPFKLRGTKLIKTMNEAKQAAINISHYLS